MRSRFAAFALADVDYLWRTLHADHADRASSREAFGLALKRATHGLKYMRLRILEAQDDRVLFLASVFERGVDRSFLELSRFVHDGTGWRYLDGSAREAQAFDDPAAQTFATVRAMPPRSP